MEMIAKGQWSKQMKRWKMVVALRRSPNPEAKATRAGQHEPRPRRKK